MRFRFLGDRLGVFRKRRSLSLTILACVISVISQNARAEQTAEERRSVLISHIRATSDCMAQEALKVPGLGRAARDNDWTAFLREVAAHCREPIDAMIRIHDQFYGAGSGRVFFNQGYFRDLPRAIRSRIGPQIDRKIAEAKARSSAEKTQPATAKKTRSAPAEKAKPPPRPQVTVKQTEQKPVEPSQYRKSLALNSAGIEMRNLRSKLYVCTDQSIAKAGALQGEIQALTETVISTCEADFEAALQSVINFFKIDAGLDNVTEAQEAMLREEILNVVRAHIISAAMENQKAR
jgi:hypothetical protein